MILVQVIEEVDTDDMTNSAGTIARCEAKCEFGAPCLPDVPKCADVLLVFGHMCSIFSSAVFW
jgi:hypothetical protein